MWPFKKKPKELSEEERLVMAMDCAIQMGIWRAYQALAIGSIQSAIECRRAQKEAEMKAEAARQEYEFQLSRVK